MVRRQRTPQSEEASGAPMWMVTFSDCMNLLLTFFVLLVTFSAFGDDPRDRLLDFVAAMRAVFGPPVPAEGRQEETAMLPTRRVVSTEQPEYGSEQPTNDDSPMARNGAISEALQASDYRSHKVFLIPSRKVFLGRGMVLSADGRYLMGVMAAFLKEVPGPAVLSENGPNPQGGGMDLGLSRALAVLEYFTSLEHLDRQRFSISAESTAPPEGGNDSGPRYHREERMLEIVLLEGSAQH